MYTKPEANSIMNSLGGSKTPFLFLVDFEMKNIQIHRLDADFPSFLSFEFPGIKKNGFTPQTGTFGFVKKPVPFETYCNAFAEIQREIHAGNTFLANLTFPTPIETNLTLQQLFQQSRAKYKILVEDAFVCFSPETFVQIHDGIILTCPMKGTISAAIENAAEKILADSKEMAEHSTIVDLLRNDISQFATDVAVKRFRYIDRISTHEGELLQVSSEITGILPEDYKSRLGDILFSLLPAGSVTGAPKTHTLQIIQQTEKTERGYYTGVCGIFDGTNLDSAVLIRFIEQKNGQLQFRSGGGITFLSEAAKEYRELIDKVYVPIAGNHQG